jgi:hypothetical protein
MHCRDFETRLNDILDDRGQPRADAQLVAHADGCDPCRQLLDGQQVLFDGLKQRQFPTTAPAFARRAVALAAPAMQVTRGASSRRIGWAIATVLSTAAAVLLIVSLVWQARRGVAPQRENTIVNSPAAPPAHPHGGANTGLAISQADWLIEAPRLPSRIRGGYRGTMDNLAIALPETVQRLDEVEHYAPGIRPIRISFGVLLDALWRTLPGSHEDDRHPTRTSYQPSDLRQIV